MSETLLDRWHKTVRQSPSALALIDGATGRKWTRAALAAAAQAWQAAQPTGAALTRRRVLMAEPNGPGWFQVFLGLLLADAIPVLADPTEPPATLAENARSLGAAFLWHDGRLRPAAPRTAARRRDVCLVKLTSGTTGRPRARVFTHAQILADGRQVCATMSIGPADLNLGVIPPGHSYGLGNLVVPLLAQGTALVCAASPLPQSLAADCVRWRPTVFPAVPTLLRALVRADLDASALACLRLVISAGAPLAPETAAEFFAKFRRRVHGFYGTSETGGISFDRSGGPTLTGASVGRPLKGVRLIFRGGNRFTVESAAVHARGRFSPPDRAKLNAAGELLLLGRTGRTVKIAGRRLDLAEVEAVLRTVPGVRDAHVIPHPKRPDALAAAVATPLTPAELRRRLGPRLARWKIPARLLTVPEFPHTARGKTDRQRLAALLQRGGGASA